MQLPYWLLLLLPPEHRSLQSELGASLVKAGQQLELVLVLRWVLVRSLPSLPRLRQPRLHPGTEDEAARAWELARRHLPPIPPRMGRGVATHCSTVPEQLPHSLPHSSAILEPGAEDLSRQSRGRQHLTRHCQHLLPKTTPR